MNKTLIAIFASALFLSGCVQKGANSGPMVANSKPAAPANSSAPAANAPRAEVLKKSGGGGGGGRADPQMPIAVQQTSLGQLENNQPAPAATERKIVRNADLQIETDAPEDAQQKIGALVEGKKGYVVESQQSSSDARATKRDTVTMTLRVPADKFAETLDEIRKTASRVVVETVKSDDVTEQFIDTESDLKAKRALEAQFLEIMKRANTVDDALNVQRELGEVRAEIEKLEGKKRFLENQSAFSTIKLRIQTPAAFSANSSGFFHRLAESFGDGLDAALAFILGLVSFVIAVLPFFLFVVLPIVLAIRYFLRKRRAGRAAASIPTDEIANE